MGAVKEVEEGGVLEQGSGDIGDREGGEIKVQSGDILAAVFGLEDDLSPDLPMLGSPVGEDAYSGTGRPSNVPNAEPYSWAEQMDNEGYYT